MLSHREREREREREKRERQRERETETERDGDREREREARAHPLYNLIAFPLSHTFLVIISYSIVAPKTPISLIERPGNSTDQALPFHKRNFEISCW